MGKYFIWACVALSFSSASFAETKADGKWHYPTSIKSMCIDTEQAIVAMYKAMVEVNSEMVANKGEDNKERMRISDHYKQSIVEYEGSWQRMGCASILYGK